MNSGNYHEASQLNQVVQTYSELEELVFLADNSCLQPLGLCWPDKCFCWHSQSGYAQQPQTHCPVERKDEEANPHDKMLQLG